MSWILTVTWLVTWKPMQARGAGFVRIVLRLQRQPRGLDVAVGDAALLDGGQHGGHLLGVGVARLARGLALAGDADADHGGVGRDRDRRFAGDRHQLVDRSAACAATAPAPSAAIARQRDQIRMHRHHAHFTGTKTLIDQLVRVGLHRIGGIFLDEQILGVELLVVEVIGDRLVGRIHRVVGAAMDELERPAGRRLADGDVAFRRVVRRCRDRHRGPNVEAGVVGLGVDRHRRAGRLDALLVEIFVERLEGVDQRVEGALSHLLWPLQVDDGALRQRHLLAEGVARLQRRRRAGRRRRRGAVRACGRVCAAMRRRASRASVGKASKHGASRRCASASAVSVRSRQFAAFAAQF